jgi:putative membrane protein
MENKGDSMTRRSYFLAVVALSLMASTACGSIAVQRTVATVSLSSTTVSEQDRAWLAEAHQANLAEVQVGRLAEKKGGTPAVRSAGAMLVTDHTKFDGEVTRVAHDLGVSLPKTAMPDDITAAKRLSGESGSQFDTDFLSTMITGHEKVIADTKIEVGKGSSPQVISLAKSALPTLNKHLNTLRKAS